MERIIRCVNFVQVTAVNIQGQNLKESCLTILSNMSIRMHASIFRLEEQKDLLDYNRTKGARLMHITSNLQRRYVLHAIYILNRVPTKANQNYMTPYERLKQEKQNLTNLKIFGSVLYGYGLWICS